MRNRDRIDMRDRDNVALMEQLQVPQNKAKRIILDLPPCTGSRYTWVEIARKKTCYKQSFNSL